MSRGRAPKGSVVGQKRKALKQPPAVARPAAGQTRVDFLEAQLRALVDAEVEAFKDGSWVAYATLKRQQREVFDALEAAQAAAAKAETGPKLTDEQIVNQRLIPAIAKLPLPLAWEVYRALGQRLGQVPAESADEVA